MYPLFGPLDTPHVHRAMYLDDELKSNAETAKKKKKKKKKSSYTFKW
ncbi:hypothetical protein QG37_00040 [Candidozyma auris]|uniref:Uncharacterized protein n=1 Tax=Candidozyma auris TaxID=498019 RepID=A0A0L0P8H1_CANAR|nr:hypothetical protein QG37_00040 [[Candida] auris]